MAWLKRQYPKLPTEAYGRFEELSESTVRTWFDKDHKLLPKFAALLEQLQAPHRGSGRSRMLEGQAEVENEIKVHIQSMREHGAVINLLVLRLVFKIVLEKRAPGLLANFKLSKMYLSRWMRDTMQYTWRVRTGAAAKLPADWRAQGVEMARRIGFAMQVYKVHPSLVINMDQTGMMLAPVGSRTFELKGSKHVKVAAADDKRQITVCIASSLDGDLLPMQLIFQGKTDACHPPVTAAAQAAKVHITHSINHWSCQETMQQWITQLLTPYVARCAVQHNLPVDSHVVLVLDVWSVHKSEEFRLFLRTHHPHVHLVFVPPNCTSQLQVADVVLQRPFKYGVRKRFEHWAAELIREQIDAGQVTGINDSLRMTVIKPMILQWCVESWERMSLSQGRELIKKGWDKCCVSLFNVHDSNLRQQVTEAACKQELDPNHVPEESEGDDEDDEDSSESEEELDLPDVNENDEKDLLDLMKARVEGTRRSTRKRTQTQVGSYMINTSQLAFSGESDIEHSKACAAAAAAAAAHH